MKNGALLMAFAFLVSASCRAEQVQWLKKYDTAVEEARKSGHPIFVDVYADWCQWCKKLDQQVYADPRFIQFSKGFVPLKLDSEDNGEGSRLADKYQIDGLPAILVLDADGHLLNKLSGYKQVDEMIHQVQRVQSLLAMEKKNPTNQDANFLLAVEYMDREMYDEARIRFERALKSPASSAVQKEKAEYSIGLAAYYAGDLEPALESMETYYNEFPNGASNEDALLLLSQLHIELKSNQKAMKYLREFMKKYPNSENAVRAKEVLTALEKECPTC